MATYSAAFYQQDTMEELSRQAEVFYYGPGFKGYDIRDSLSDVLRKSSFPIDCIITGHSWLSESPEEEITFHPRIDLNEAKVPLVAILNKEYNNLDKKLAYLSETNFDLVFTHHHDAEKFTDKIGIRCIFWPFAFAENKIQKRPPDSGIDLLFSGILQNQTHTARQSDTRIRVLRTMFSCLGDLPIRKKKKYSDFRIFWNSLPRSKGKADKLLRYRLAKLIFPTYGYNQLDTTQYYRLLAKSKLVFNSLSPAQLVGPRFFETMASGAVVFCGESDLYRELFLPTSYVSFRDDLSDFYDKLKWYIQNDSDREEIANIGREFAYQGHKWSDRIRTMSQEINNIC